MRGLGWVGTPTLLDSPWAWTCQASDRDGWCSGGVMMAGVWGIRTWKSLTLTSTLTLTLTLTHTHTRTLTPHPSLESSPIMVDLFLCAEQEREAKRLASVEGQTAKLVKSSKRCYSGVQPLALDP